MAASVLRDRLSAFSPRAAIIMSKSHSHLDRRSFVSHSASIAAGSIVSSGSAKLVSAADEPGKPAENSPADRANANKSAAKASFASQWDLAFDRVWLGPEYWANPLQDWRLIDGRLEATVALPDRNVQLLTADLSDESGDLAMSVMVGRFDDRAFAGGNGTAGFRVGIRGPLDEYRNSLIYGRGLDAGITARGGLFIGNPRSATALPPEKLSGLKQIELRLHAEPTGKNYRVTLAAHHPKTGDELGKVERLQVPTEQLVGNIGLAVNVDVPAGRPRARQNNNDGQSLGNGRFWFRDWRASGGKLALHPERAFGPILFSQYTLSNQVLKLTAQMPPIGAGESQVVQLQTRPTGDETWQSRGEAKIDADARTATFRIADWDDSRDADYRLIYADLTQDGVVRQHFWTGTVRRDPVDRPELVVADISCNIHAAFPNSQYVEHTERVDPDFIAFVGDQFYESTGGYGVTRDPLDRAVLDYLRKWYIHGWTWRELTRNRPSVSLPDDHDVYQGNVWGEGGAGRQQTQEAGGYGMPAAWVNVVHRTQSSHHPDAYDPTPIKQDISVYYGPLTYGRVSFAVIADRMFKTGPDGVAPPTTGRADHVTDPSFDPKTADVPGAELLGERQMKFLREWANDWRGADMKAVISQTIFTAMATHHGGEHMRLVADYDTNAWPQTARNEALRVIRKCFAVHLAGDQHLPAVVHYGIDQHRDAGVAFAGPAVNVGYPRTWEPQVAGMPGADKNEGLTGDFLDHFHHPLTVLAVKNPETQQRRPVLEQMEDKASGLGIVRFRKPERSVLIECWPYLTDPTAADARQFPGWPIQVAQTDNYAAKIAGHLPTIQVRGAANPVVHVIDEATSETVYSLRIAGDKFQPHVFADGTYTVRVSDPEAGRSEQATGLKPAKNNLAMVAIDLN